MKRFQLTIKDGRKVIYQSIFSYNPEQEKAYLARILEEGTSVNQLESELEAVVIQTIGQRNWQKERKKWNDDMTLRDYVEQYPDITICASIQNSVYDCRLFPDLTGLESANEAEEEVLIDKTGNIGWKCVRVD